ncbi:trigger factor [Methylolobus aquaticus]
MQISVERIDELNRKLTVQVPEATIRERVNSRLQSLAREAKFDGFRPGKVPATLIKKRFGAKVREEVLGDLIESTFAQAVRDEKLRPAGMPHISTKAADEGSGLEYEAAFEVFPEFVLMPVETLDVKRYTSSIAEQDVDSMIERLRDQRRSWRAVERPAATGDRVTVHFSGNVDGESLSEERIQNFPVVLGGNQTIPGFEGQLEGAVAGASLVFDLEFPTDYHNSKWAGKSGHFDVEVASVEETVLPDLDAEFAKSLGIEDGDLEALRRDVRENMEREMQRGLKSRTKTALMDMLYQRNPIVLPSTLVESEIKDLISPQVERAGKTGQSVDEAALREKYEPLARRRVALALILNQLIEVNQLKANPKKVRETVEEMAASYEQPDQVIHWYYSNADHLREIENLVLEDEVVAWVLERARVTDETIGFQELMQPAVSGQ